MTRNLLLWIIWIGVTLIAGGTLAIFMFVAGPRDILLIGGTTSAHAQIEASCESCHTTSIIENFTKHPKKIAKAMNKACLSCHEDEKKVSNDSHPPKKFRGAKAAKLRAALNAENCSTCHTEHIPEITGQNAVTLPPDLCSACHQSVGEDRVSHKDLGFETCASAGCHNFHDNTALYENFLVKNAGGEWVSNTPINPHAQLSVTSAIFTAQASKDPAASLKAYLDTKAEEDTGDAAIKALANILTSEDAIAPLEYKTQEAIEAWAPSAHAINGVNCAGCHAPQHAQETQLRVLEESWVEKPVISVCADCHTNQVETFAQGKHGMRLHPKLAKPRTIPEDSMFASLAFILDEKPLPPMKVGESVLAHTMKPSAHDKEINTCNACHAPHDVNIKVAAVESCVSCHNDTHTQNYFTSPHHNLWQAELSGDAAVGTGVSCASCHMPKIEDRKTGFFTTHNQNAYFRPNEKMIRPVCMSCHSLDFSIDALADPELVENNFNGRPSVHIESIDWALKREE